MEISKTRHFDRQPMPPHVVHVQSPNEVVHDRECVGVDVTVQAAEHVHIVIDQNARVKFSLLWISFFYLFIYLFFQFLANLDQLFYRF